MCRYTLGGYRLPFRTDPLCAAAHCADGAGTQHYLIYFMKGRKGLRLDVVYTPFAAEVALLWIRYAVAMAGISAERPVVGRNLYIDSLTIPLKR